ncbi:MAG: response regulator [Anaerolineales bacterium]
MENYRVLLIDPDIATTNYLSRLFHKENFEVFAANSSKEGLILAYQYRPHVIILDPILKDMNLEELLSKLKKDWRVSRTKIIAFSSLFSCRNCSKRRTFYNKTPGNGKTECRR